MSIPNQITLARLAFAGVFLYLLSNFSAESWARDRWVLAAAFWVFLAAALSDVLDGLLARALGQVTVFGRVVDPLVDKLLVCGAFVLFAGHGFYLASERTSLSGVEPWMAVVILAREMLVSLVRAEGEARGVNFAALRAGKIKMLVQCTAVGVILAHLAWFPDLQPVVHPAVWLAVIVTVLSVVPYLGRASLRGIAASAGARPRAPADLDDSVKPAAGVLHLGPGGRSKGLSA